MHVKNFFPEMDTANGSVQPFNFYHLELDRTSIDVYLGEPTAPIAMKIICSEISEVPELDICNCCDEIIAMDRLQKVIRGTIDHVMVWDGTPDPQVLLFAERTGVVKVIVAIGSDGPGLMQVADSEGVFMLPEKVEA